jgi:hypothetical protein
MRNPFTLIGKLQRDLADVKTEIEVLRGQVASQQQIQRSGEIFEKAFRVTGFLGDYVEFGAYRGDSLIQAYFASRRVLDELLSGFWDHSFDNKEAVKRGFEQCWNAMRFISFDSFAGMPAPKGVDSIYRHFPEGSYACTEEEFRGNVRKYGIPDAKVISVPGFFCDTLNDRTAQSLNLTSFAVIHIDSDLYESARDALQFATPFVRDGTILVFDDWFQFLGNPQLGEQRALREWSDSHPEWAVTSFQKEGAYRNSFILSKASVDG